MPFFVAQRDLVKGDNGFPEFVASLRGLQSAAFKRANDIWPGFQPGGVFPGPLKYGLGPLRKNDMAGDTTDSTPSGSYSFSKTFTATAWGDIFRYTVRANTIHAFAGFAFPDPILRTIQIRMEIGDRLYPIWDLQEAQSFKGGFAMIFKQDEATELIAEPINRVLVRLYQEVTGPQRVVPLGLHLYRNLNAVLSET